MSDECVFCKKKLDDNDTVVLRDKGSQSINRASQQKGSNVRTCTGQRVHKECRRVFTHPNTIRNAQENESEQDQTSSIVLRSESQVFRFDQQCLFCGQPCKKKWRDGNEIYSVITPSFHDTIVHLCEERKDEWSMLVAGRIAFVQDLVAANAKYHQSCSVNFRTGKQVPEQHDSAHGSVTKKQKLGRPKRDESHEAFLHITKYLEDNDDEQITITDLIEKMETSLSDSQSTAYGFTHMKNKLMEHFGDSIMITEVNGRPNVVTFRRKAARILDDFYQEQKKEDPNREKMRMIDTVAKLLKSDIKKADACNDVYPSKEQLSSTEGAIRYLPESLLTLLRGMFVGENTDLKVASIGQAIMQATRPRVILAPLQFGLAVEMHHQFASRFIVDTLHKHGFCCSYSEVQRFEMSAAHTQGDDLPERGSGDFVQYVGDNVDHNVRTLDGYGTFHGMGIISTFTPGKLISKPVPRVSVTTDDIIRLGRINITNFRSQDTGCAPLTFQELQAIEVGLHDPTYHVDLLWEISLAIHAKRPAWSGFMQTVHQGEFPGKSSVQFLPMIDMDPTDTCCIFSTLTYVCKQANSYNVTPVITFDQPLWWKALMMIQSEPSSSPLKSVVLRLGGLHMEMSFLGSIGYLMAESGLQEVLEVVYSGNAVKQMLSGKAISRAVRGHLLVDAALNTILVANAYNLPLPSYQPDQLEHNTSVDVQMTGLSEDMEIVEESVVSDYQSEQDLLGAKEIFELLLVDPGIVGDLSSSEILSRVAGKLREERDSMRDLKTAQLWLQYMEMISILKRFLKAERTGNWMLHLAAVQDMLPFFAAAGHNLYAKSAYLYLQQMNQLDKTHPDVHRSFMNGFHVVRRSDRYWAGLSTDLVIEQVLMRSVKTSGGLTRGRGMTEIQRLIWILGMPSCADVNFAMQELSGVNYSTSEQHKDVSESRQRRDTEDTFKLIEAFGEWDPFGSDPSLHSIVSGVAGNDKVNVDKARSVGQSVISSMAGRTVTDWTFQRKNQAVTLGSRSTVVIDGDSVQVDPYLLFQRLTVIATRKDQEDPAGLFKYELCSHPTAIFDNSGLPREPNKAALGDALWEMVKQDHKPTEPTSDDLHYVLDGGALVHRLPWTRGQTFEKICHAYVTYVTNRYGKATVVFDGYVDGPTIKDATHCRHTGSSGGPNVTFTGETKLKLKKNVFLGNKVNKQRFLHLLSSFLEKAGCTTVHAKGDADILIAKTAIESAKIVNTVLIADDTDLLILLCYHGDAIKKELLLKPEIKLNAKQQKVWSIPKARKTLGEKLCSRLLFVHALLGCDTTSRLFGIGKQVALKKVQNNSDFQQLADLFTKSDAAKEDIIAAGERAIIHIYNGQDDEDIDTLRYKRFCEKVAKNNAFVEPQTLPPTSAATKYHSLRVYYQVQTWKETARQLRPEEWGWQIVNCQLMPVKTNLPAAPQKLMKIFRCDCKTACNTNRCTCKRVQVDCTWMCGVCKGVSCANSARVEIDDIPSTG